MLNSSHVVTVPEIFLLFIFFVDFKGLEKSPKGKVIELPSLEISRINIDDTDQVITNATHSEFYTYNSKNLIRFFFFFVLQNR